MKMQLNEKELDILISWGYCSADGGEPLNGEESELMERLEESLREEIEWSALP